MKAVREPLDPGQLRYALIEHVIESFKEHRVTALQLAAMAGCDKNTANRVLRGEQELNDWQVRTVRRSLETCVEGLVSCRKGEG